MRIRERLDTFLHTGGQRLKEHLALNRDEVVLSAVIALYVFGAAVNLVGGLLSGHIGDGIAIAVLFIVLIANQYAVQGWKTTSAMWRKTAEGWQETSNMWRELAERQMAHQEELLRKQMERWRN